MATLLLSKPAPVPVLIKSGDLITLDYNISGNDPTDIRITYQLDPGDNTYFDTGEKPVKEISKQIHLTNPPLPILDQVKVIKSGKKPSLSTARLHIYAVDLNNSETDQQLLILHFQ